MPCTIFLRDSLVVEAISEASVGDVAWVVNTRRSCACASVQSITTKVLPCRQQ